MSTGPVTFLAARALVQVACAVAIGVPAAVLAARLLASEVYGVKTSDPMTLGGAVALLLGCALLAGLIPANRASRVDPMQALRSE